jgi:glycosyltransferase involved in cell wall biosynthesis
LINNINVFIENNNIFFLILFHNFTIKNNDEEDFFSIGDEEYLKIKIVRKFNRFIKFCQNNLFIDKRKYPLLNNPKISAIIPIYNAEKYLNYSIKTIQNQKLKEIEIILINDCSTDNSLNIIKHLMEEDPRIRLIQNIRNRKIFYSKSIAALSSNGEFILELDQDDMFIRDDLFNMLYDEAKLNNYDLVQFRDFLKKDFHFDKKTRINFNPPLNKSHWVFPKQIFNMKQPELKATMFRDNNNYLLWGLLIKSNLYKQSVEELWELVINYKIIYNEDYIMTFCIIKSAKNYKYLNKFGIIHLIHKNATSFKCYFRNELHICNLFYLNYLDYYHVKDHPKDVNIISDYIYRNIGLIIKAKSLFPELFNFNIRNIISNKYLLKENLEIILNKLNITNEIYRKLSSYKYIMNDNEFFSIKKYQKSINNIINSKQKSYRSIKNINYKNQLIDIPSKYEANFIKNSSLFINKISIEQKRINNTTTIIPKFKFSIIIYCNELKFLEQTIVSVIEQKEFSSYEIIIIFDNAKFKNFDLKYISYLYRKNNIQFLNNFHKKGLIYSYSISALLSQGEYILNFMPGYTFAKKNILIKLDEVTKINKVDILEFNLLINKEKKITKSSLDIYKCHHYKTNINLSLIKYNKNFRDINQEKELLINKLIKSNKYKDIIFKYNLLKYDEAIYNNFDEILIFLLNKEQCSFKHIDTFGIIKNIKYINSMKLNKIYNDNLQKSADNIFYINFLFDNTVETEKKFAYDEYVNKLFIINRRFNSKTNESNKLFQKFMQSKFINITDKIELKSFYNLLN